ncbi:MAG: cell division protein FtsZ [Melioribacteraceae bacterium]|nr:cell division protein FtsZ [Melioribacteraceae bacterium]
MSTSNELREKRPRFFQLETQKPLSAQIKVVGVGGGGCNAVDSMINRGLRGVEFIAVNTDAQVLEASSASQKIQIGTNVTRGLGAGADPNIGRKAAEEDKEKITRALDGADMVFITAGMGGGTGTGAAPLVASIAKSLGALVIATVTKPFNWEGKKRMKNAEEGIKELKQFVDSMIVIPNSRILSIIDTGTSAEKAFDKPNEILYEATRGISDIITIRGIINVDFADVRTVMKDSGQALMGCGISSGENRAVDAAHKAISSPLLEGISIKGAKDILLNVSGPSSMTMQEIELGNNVIFEAAGNDVNVIFGAVIKEDMQDYISYTVIATGFDEQVSAKPITELKGSTKTAKPWPGIDFSNKKGFGIIDEKNIEIPTIQRINNKSDNKNLDGGLFDLNTGYPSQEVDNEISENDIGITSSLLRKMMD